MPVPNGYIPGAPQPAPMLSRFAQTAATPPENFVGNLVFPDTQTDTLLGKAAVRPNEELLVDDDDLIGAGTDYPEILLSESETEFELGLHGRKATIYAHDILKAQMAARMSDGGGDPAYNLETRATGILVAQNTRRNELLKMNALQNTALYPVANVFPSIVIDTADNVRESLIEMSEQVEAAGQGPANLIIFGRGALRGADRNANLLALLPADQPKVLTRSLIQTLMRMPEDASRVEFATAVYRQRPGGPDIAMFDMVIWVGRVKPAPDGKAAFGWNYWVPENGKRFYMSRAVLGVQENREIGLRNYYKVSPEDMSLGCIRPVTLSA